MTNEMLAEIEAAIADELSVGERDRCSHVEQMQWLVAEVRRLRAELAVLRGTLEQIADLCQRGWPHGVCATTIAMDALRRTSR